MDAVLTNLRPPPPATDTEQTNKLTGSTLWSLHTTPLALTLHGPPWPAKFDAHRCRPVGEGG